MIDDDAQCAGSDAEVTVPMTASVPVVKLSLPASAPAWRRDGSDIGATALLASSTYDATTLAVYAKPCNADDA
ncbi:hypothetical protein WI845_16680 [Vibrio cholerae]